MNTEFNDDDLRDFLRKHWRVEVGETPGFRRAVWARIDAERRAPASWGAWLRLHFVGVGALVAASLVLAAAGGAGLAGAREARERERVVARYAASIDPHLRVGFAIGSASSSVDGGRGDAS